MAVTLRNTDVVIGSSVMGPTGSIPSYTCRAWVNFNGNYPPSIRASGNVESITWWQAGDYTVNFITAMPSANYAWLLNGSATSASSIVAVIGRSPDAMPAPSSSSLRMLSVNAGSNVDFPYVCCQIFC